jgi:hypothetical protein
VFQCDQIRKTEFYAAGEHTQGKASRLVGAKDIAFAESENALEIQSEAPQLQFDEQRHMLEALEGDGSIAHL